MEEGVPPPWRHGMSDKRNGRNEKADYGDGIADVFDT
jgi:hypothetical protein